ncbi:carbohydrate kinase family protein [Arenibacter palladensis]|uniref:carbohydrate kinase family protein n=1 Tax=Arenibacter palladensis TaxID=237373 RepID=UPI0026E35BF1|nr:carbohydrate kinase [Arenibacter palladensis]MDO6602844.1 carbohydrate kinase [Arenibacter palladensis]
MKMNSDFRIAGLGELLWDVQGDSRTLGGAPANFAFHCQNLGAQSYVISCLGNDGMGDQAKYTLSKHGINIDGLATSLEHRSGFVNVELDSKGKPLYEIVENVAWDHIHFTTKLEHIASQLDAVCFGTLAQRSTTSKESIEKFLDATSNDCLRVFDINIRQNYYSDEVILSSLSRSNVLKINDEELPMLSRLLGVSGSESMQLKKILKKCNLKLAILTCGSRGAFMLTETEGSFIKPPKLKSVVSTVGAGDSFMAASVMGFLNKNKLDKINKDANELAAMVCSQNGAMMDFNG